MESIEKRAIEAAIRYLGNKGYDILDDGHDGGIVAKDGEGIAFVSVTARAAGEGLAGPEPARAEREAAAARWLAGHAEVVNMPFRFDDIALVPVSGDRAMLRHHVNSLGTLEG